jgi:hypothetical protein
MDIRFDDKNAEKALGGIAHAAMKTFSKVNPQGAYEMRNDAVSLSLGGVNIDAAAAQFPTYVGDSRRGKILGMTPQMEALWKANKAGVQFVPNRDGTKWDVQWNSANPRNLTGDSLYSTMGNMTMDAVGTFINGSLMAPNSISWITELFKQPLSWSRMKDLVKIQTGTSPWAVTQAMAAVRPAGWGAVNTSGGAGNTMSQDVEAQLDMIEQQIININTTYKLTVDELERAKGSGQEFALAGQVIAFKQDYARWIPEIIENGLITFGNPLTNTAGLLTINAITAWTSVGSNQALETIQADGANVTKGSKIYQQFAAAAVSYLNPMKNNVKKVHARMSPEAFNVFTTVPYSDSYNPSNPLQIFGKSFDAGGKEIVTGSIGGVAFDIACDPMLSGSGRGNFFNTQTYDYLVFTADALAAGPTDESQSLIHYGEPLGEFVYPTLPQQASTQYSFLKRVSGIFAPYSNAIKVYSGYGYAS